MQAVGRIEKSMMERFHELQNENEELRQRLGEMEEKLEVTDGQAYQNSANADQGPRRCSKSSSPSIPRQMKIGAPSTGLSRC